MRENVAEFIGTFGLMFAGTGAIIANDLYGGSITHMGISIVFGLIVMSMIYAVGDISGAHLNPAVTFGFWLAKRIKTGKALGFALSQALAALAVSGLFRLVFPDHPTLGATLPQIDPAAAFLFEVLLTFFLMFVILHVSHGAKEKGLMAGIAIGGLVGLSAMFAGRLSGASMNPIRSLAPALMSGQLQHLWIYLTAPWLGAALAVASCAYLRVDCCLNEPVCETEG